MTPFLRIDVGVSNLRYRNPVFLSPPSRSARHLPIYLRFVKFFQRKNLTRFCGNFTELLPSARHAADCRFLSSLACGSFHLVSVVYKGKKSITSDALFADLLLFSPSLRDTSPYHKGRHFLFWLPCAKGAGCRRQTEELSCGCRRLTAKR